MRQKIRFQSAWLDQFSIGVGSIQHDFRLIESIFLTDRKSVREFFKRLFSRDSSHCSFFFKSSLSSSWTNPPQVNFCRFLPNFSQGFLSSSASKTLLPLLFHFIYIFHAFEVKFSDLWIFGVFDF